MCLSAVEIRQKIFSFKMSALPPFLAIQAESHVKILSQLSDVIQIRILSQISGHPNTTWNRQLRITIRVKMFCYEYCSFLKHLSTKIWQTAHEICKSDKHISFAPKTHIVLCFGAKYHFCLDLIQKGPFSHRVIWSPLRVTKFADVSLSKSNHDCVHDNQK